MKHSLSNNKGIAMVTALAFITCLALLAAIIIAVAISEKKITSNEYAHGRSFYSADAAGEAAINWLRAQSSPPGIVDEDDHVFVPVGYSNLSQDHRYQFRITYLRKTTRPGWGAEYKDFEYNIEAVGASSQESESQIVVQASRLFKEGY
ncbi:MAG: hypothetical protein NTX17_06645 [Candidatus Eisenbacteria bacterium]|nr:hypothetical protein [Candidatus Eisenbacteria bacterium]